MEGARVDQLLCLIFADPGIEHGGEALGDAAWEELVELAATLNAAGLFAARLRDRGLLERVPHDSRERLLRAYRDNTAHALRLEHELRALLADFEREAIAVAPLKGGSLLLAGVHRDVGARFFNDLDILTRRADRERVDELLRRRGFALARSGDGPKHLPPYRRGNVFLEVHEVAYWEANGARVDLDRWLTQGPTLALTIAHLVHHLFVSSVTEPILALKTLWDVRELSRHGAVPWGAAALSAERAGLAAELEMLRGSVARLARGDAGEVTALCTPISASELERRELAFTVRALLRAPAWYSVAHARNVLFPTRASMEAIHGAAPGAPWVLAAYATRPFALAAKALGRVANASRNRLDRL